MGNFDSHKWIKLAKQGRLNEGDPTLAYWADDKMKQAKAGEKTSEGFDSKYFIEQTEALIDTIEEFEQEIGTSLEMMADETGDSYWKQQQNQTTRYIMGAHKQLSSLLKKLETGERRVGKGIYKIK